MMLLIISKLLKKIKPKVKLALLFLYIFTNTSYNSNMINAKFMTFIQHIYIHPDIHGLIIYGVE